MPMTLDRAGVAAQNALGKMFLEVDKTFGVTTSLGSGMMQVVKTVEMLSAATKEWGASTRNVGGFITTNADVWKASFEQLGDAIGHTSRKMGDIVGTFQSGNFAGGAKKLFDFSAGGGASGDFLKNLFNGDDYTKRLEAGEQASYEKKLAEIRSTQKAKREAAGKGAGPHVESAAEKKTRESQEKQGERFKDYLSDLKQSTKELQLQNDHMTTQAAVAKALYDAEQKKGVFLTEGEKKLVTAAALEKQRATDVKKAAEEAKKQAEAYSKMSAELAGQAAALDLELKGQQAAGEWEQKRLEFEEKIKEAKLSQQQADELRSQFAANQAKEQETQHQAILKNMKEERENLDLELSGRKDLIPLIKIEREEEEKGILTQQRKLEIEQEFWRTKHDEGLKTVQDMLDKGNQDLQQQEMKLRGLDDYIPMLEKVRDIQKQIGLSDAEKADAIALLKQQTDQTSQLNRAMDYQKSVVDSIMKGGDGYVNQVKKLNEALGSGSINVKQYNDAMGQLVANGKKASDFATSFAKTITDGFSNAITKGEKLGDTFKNIGKSLLGLTMQKASGFLANGLDNIFGRLGGMFGGGGSGRTMPFGGGGSPFGGAAVSSPVENDISSIAMYSRATFELLSTKLEGRAYGGGVRGGMPYLVGERGPEMFFPNSSGYVASNQASFGGGGQAWGGPTSYQQQAMAFSRLASYRANQYQQQGLGLQALLANNMINGGSKAWAAWSSMNPGFGNTPQIAWDVHDWQGLLDRDPALAGVFQPGFADSIRGTSGGQGRSSYTFLPGAMSSGWMGSAGDNAQNPLDDGRQDFSIGGRSAIESYWKANLHYANKDRPTAFNRDWYGNAGARFQPLSKLGQFLNQEYNWGAGPMNDVRQASFSGFPMGPSAPDGWGRKAQYPPLPSGGWGFGAPSGNPLQLPGGGFNFNDDAKINEFFKGVGRPRDDFEGTWSEKPMSPWGWAKQISKQLGMDYKQVLDSVSDLIPWRNNAQDQYDFQKRQSTQRQLWQPFQPGQFDVSGIDKYDEIIPRMGQAKLWDQDIHWPGIVRNADGTVNYAASTRAASRGGNRVFRASGGYFDGSSAMVVGERGPEVIVPSTAGNVIPNDALRGGMKVEIHNYAGVDVDVQERPDGRVIATIRKMIADNNKNLKNMYKLRPQPTGR
jgi:phage-related minor tail protein